MIAVCGSICGADNWVAIAEFGRAKTDWLKTFLALPNGIPSHDTFGRVFARISPWHFQDCFTAWVQSLMPKLADEGEIVPLDCAAPTIRARAKPPSTWCMLGR